MRGDMLELFHRRLDGSRADRMRFAVEVLVPPEVTDAFGDSEEVSHTRLRYELAIELRSAERGGLRPYVADEQARLVAKARDRWIGRQPIGIRGLVARYGRSRTDPLVTEAHQGRPTFVLRTGGQGRPRQLPASEATATVLSSLSTAGEFPLLYALKQELQSWRLLQLDPAALRTPASYDEPDSLATNGAGLANALRRIADDTSTQDRPDGVLSDIVADLAAVISGVRDLDIVDDDVRRQRHLEVTLRGEAAYSARVASDGTLRALALLAALYDPRDSGLICFEEPENGLFPGRLISFLSHLRDRVVPPAGTGMTGQQTRLRQLLVSSHSPAVLQALGPALGGKQVRDDVVFVDLVTRMDPHAPRSRISRVRKIGRDLTSDELDARVSTAEPSTYEEVPPHQIVGASEIAEMVEVQ